MKEKEQLTPQKYKDYKKILWTTTCPTCQQTGQPGQNIIPRNIESSKTKSGRIGESE